MMPINGYKMPAAQRMSPKVQRLIWKISGTGLTDPGFSLKVNIVMRPCDGTSGLVRGTAERRFSRLRGPIG